MLKFLSAFTRVNVQGVLSLFCVLKAGAAHVIAIEASSMATVCREMAAAHGVSDHITVLNARVEDLQGQLPGLPPGGGADVIVSEWMGTVRTTSIIAHFLVGVFECLWMVSRGWSARVCLTPSCTRATRGSILVVAFFRALRGCLYQAGSTLPLQSCNTLVSAPLRKC